MAAEKTNCNSRQGEIDALRGLAVLLMVFSHGLRWVYIGNPATLLPLGGLLTPGDLATPMFYLAAGLSLYLSMQGGLRKNLDLLLLRQRFTARLGKLFFIGVCMSLVWGVLQAQAVTLLILVWLLLSLPPLQSRRALRLFLPGLIVLALGLHLLCRELCLPLFWHRLLADQFPLFAIFALNATGFYLATYLRHRHTTFIFTAIGIFLGLTAVLPGLWQTALQRQGAPLPFLLLGTGSSIFLLGIFRLSPVQKTKIFRCLQQVGSDALFIFVFHYAAFFLPLYLLGFTGKLSAAAALAFALMLSAAVILTAWWRRHSTFTIYDLVDLIFLALQTELLQPLVRGAAGCGAYLFSALTSRTYPGITGLRRQL